MWLSDISPLRAGTVGSLSDNNLAEINVPIFASSVNRFLTFSSKRTIFGVFYSFPVHNYVISTKNKLPLAVYFPVSYTEIGARIRVRNHEASSKIMLVCYFFTCFGIIELSDNTVRHFKNLCRTCKTRPSAPDPPQKNRRAARDSALSAPKTAPVLFGYKNISRGAARYPNALALPGVPLWNTSELFAPVCGLPGQTPRTPYITGHPIYKERK